MSNSKSICSYAIDSLNSQARAIDRLSKRVGEEFESVIKMILDCSGRVVISGMGKSGLVGKKISATLASTGTPSFFMHPAEGLHGDLGMVRKDDVVVLISNSGETEEILRLLPVLHHFGNDIVAMVGQKESTLGRSSKYVLDVSVERESCPLNLAPTTSTVATMAMGDALAVTLMNQRNFQPQDFALFHPGGNLGRRLLTRACDVMHRIIPTVLKETSLQETLISMTEGRLGLAVVINDVGRLEGLFTDGDLRRALSIKGAKMDEPVCQYMTQDPKTISPDAMLAEVEEIMHENKIRCLIVMNELESKPIGVIEIFDR